MEAPISLADEKAGVFEHAHVSRDRRQRDVERLGELGDRAFAGRESRQHRSPRGIAQRRECRVEDGRLIVNQRVNYYA